MNETFITLAAIPTHVRFTGNGGWPLERERARQELNAGQEYVILHLDVGRSSSTVFIADLGGRPAGEYNAAMFDFLAAGVDLPEGAMS